MEYVFQAHKEIMGSISNSLLLLLFWLTLLLFGCKSNVVNQEFEPGSKCPDILLDSAQVEDLVLPGHVWGFLKYYHPAVSAGDNLIRTTFEDWNHNMNGEVNTAMLDYLRIIRRIEINIIHDL